jgi:hypothetical protein
VTDKRSTDGAGEDGSLDRRRIDPESGPILRIPALPFLSFCWENKDVTRSGNYKQNNNNEY